MHLVLIELCPRSCELLNRLDASGHMQRIPFEENRHTILIALTEKNKALQKTYDAVSDEMRSIFYPGFSQKEIYQLEDYLIRILGNLVDNNENKLDRKK